jgi:hypothetical protein
MKKIVVLLAAAVVCISALAQDKKVEPDVPAAKTYNAPVDKVFRAMAQAAAPGPHVMGVTSKDTCLVQFTTRSRGYLLQFTMTCNELPDGRTRVNFHVDLGGVFIGGE